MNKRCRKQPIRAKTIASVVAALFEAAYASSGLANPTGAQVVSGSVSVNSPSSSQMNITQGTQNAIVNWNTFSIGSGESVNIAQPSASAALLNRVVGNDPSSIAGQLNANGRVFIVNPAGVIFSQGSSVNVGSLVASTLNISNADFLDGNYHFIGASMPAGVTNAGTLSAQQGGTIALLGGTVNNNGTVTAKLGTVALGAGSDITLDFAGDGLTTLAINQSAAQAVVGNTGTLEADGGLVVMSAQTADALAASVVNQQGIVRAQSLTERDGHIILDGGSSGVTTVGGTVDATGGAGLTGGQIDVTGYDVALVAGANLDASGAAGGGAVHFGGGPAGQDPTIQDANAIWMDPTAQIHADALTNGNGGSVVAFSDTSSRLYGTLTAKGGPQGGNGGTIETSGHYLDTTDAQIDASAPMGVSGTWKIDPFELDIVSELSGPAASGPTQTGTSSVMFGPDEASSQLLNTTIQSELNNGTSVTISTVNSPVSANGAGDINVEAPITMTGTAAAGLTLSASGSINVTSNITSTGGPLALTMNADVGASPSAGTGVVSINDATIDTNGGALAINSGTSAQVSIMGSSISTEAGAMTINGNAPDTGTETSAIALGYNTLLSTTSGNVTLTGTSLLGDGVDIEGSAIQTADGQISITGSGVQEAAGIGFGVYVTGGYTPAGSETVSPALSTTGSGSISVNGSSTGTSPVGVSVDSAAISASGTGSIALTGTAEGEDAYGLSLDASTVQGTSGAIGLTGTGTTTTAGASTAGGLSVTSSTVNSTTGDITVTGTATTAGNVYAGSGVGVETTFSSFGTTSGNIAVSGTAAGPGSTLFGTQADGVLVIDGYTPPAGGNPVGAFTSTAGGTINVDGSAQGAIGSGVSIEYTQLAATTGSISLDGSINATNATNSSGDNGLDGVTLFQTSLATSGGNVNIAGTVTGGTVIAQGVNIASYYTPPEATPLPTIQTDSGNITITGSAPATSMGSDALYTFGTTIESNTGAIALSGTSTGTPSTTASSAGVVLDGQNGSGYVPTSITTGSGALSIDGSGVGEQAPGVAVEDGTTISSTNGGAIDIRGVSTGTTTGTTGGNIQYDYGTLIEDGTITSALAGSTISIAGSTNTSDAGLAIGAVPMPATQSFSNTTYETGPVTITGASSGLLTLRAANDGTATSLAVDGEPTIQAPGGTLAILPGSVDPTTFALVAQDTTPITLFGTGGGLSIDEPTFATLTSNVANVVLGSTTQTGLITVDNDCTDGVCAPGGVNLTLSNEGSGSQGIQLPNGLSMGETGTLTLASAGPVTQGAAIQANQLVLAGPGTFTLNNAGNSVEFLSTAGTGNVNFTDSQTLSLNAATVEDFDEAAGTVTTIGSLSTMSIGGNLSVIGAGDIDIDTPVMSTANGATTLSLSAAGTIGVDAGSNESGNATIAATGAGPLNISLDADVGGASDGTGVSIVGSTIDTNGGAFTVNGNSQSWVTLTGSTISTGSGNVAITGNISNGGAIVLGYEAVISTTTGNITLTGTSLLGDGVNIGNSTIQTTAGGKISITGSGSSSEGTASGVYVNGSTIEGTSGAINLNGTSTATTGSAQAYGVYVANSLVSNTTGSVGVTGNAILQSSNGGYEADGVLTSTSEIATTSGNISVNGTSSSTDTNSIFSFPGGVAVFGGYQQNGVNLAPAFISTAGGSIDIQGSAEGQYPTTFSMSNALISTTTGSITIDGSANATIDGTGFNALNSMLTTTSGAITVGGSVDASAGADGTGVSLSDTSLTTTTGAVNVTGTVTGTPLEAVGVELDTGYTPGGGETEVAGAQTADPPSIQTGSGSITVAGSAPATTEGSTALDLYSASIISTSGAITLSGTTTGTATAGTSGVGTMLSGESGASDSGFTVTSIQTGSGTLSIDGSGAGQDAPGVVISNGTTITSTNGGAIDIRGVSTSPTTSTSGGNIQYDYGTLIEDGTITSTAAGSTISIAGSTNTSDAGLAIGAVPMPTAQSGFYNDPYETGPVTITGAPNGALVLSAANDNTSQSLLVRGATITGGNGTLAIASATVDPATFALSTQDATPITLFGTSGGMAIDAQTFASFTQFASLSLGSSTQTGLITVNGQCASSGGSCTLTKPTLAMNLTLSNAGAGSQGITLPFGIDVGNHTLALQSGGSVTDPGGITAAQLLLAGPGNFTLTDPQNDVGTIEFSNAGTVDFSNSVGFVIGPVTAQSLSATGAPITIGGGDSTLTGNLTAQATTGNISLGSTAAGGPNTNLSAGGTIDLVMENGVFVSPDSGTVSATNGWRIWASTWNGETRGNVQPDTSQPNFYGCTFGAGCSWGGMVPLTGDHYVYVARPTVIVTADGETRVVGAPNPAFLYTVSGLINGDTAAGTLSGSLSSTANQGSPAGSYPIDPAFLSSVGYIVDDVPGTLTVTAAPPTVPQFAEDMPMQVGAQQSYFGNEEKTFVYENNLQGTNICIGSDQPLFTTTTPGDGQDMLAVEWRRVREQPNLNSCLLLNSQHGCGDF